MEVILITGVAGFVGSNVAEALLAEGHYVIGVDNLDDSYDLRFKEEHLKGLRTHPNFRFEHLDICDNAALQKLFTETKPTLVAHLAAKVDTRAAVNMPHVYVDNNITGTINVFDAARTAGVKNTVFVSSSSVYGNSTVPPWREDAPADRSISPYGATKRAAEIFAHTYHHNFGMNITCLRYFNVYGEHNRPTMVPYKWAEALLRGESIEISGGGTRKRDYTYVGDTVRATIAALKKPLGFEIINVGNNHPLSLSELLAVFEKVVGTKAKVIERESHHASVEETYADITKAKTLLDWEPKVGIEEGVSRLVAWMKVNRL